MAEIIKKKLINEYDRCAYNVDADGNPILDDPKFTDAANFIPEIAEDKQNAYIDPQELITKSIDGILTDPENRTLWINGMPYGNAYVGTAEGPFHAEIFNDYETNTISKDAHYSHIEGRHNSINGASEGSHVEGGSSDKGNSVTDSKYVHVEGRNNYVLNNADYSHTEGDSNVNNAVGAHIEGYKNTINTTANYSHIDGAYNVTYNPYEHAQGVGNWSRHYLDENGGDEQNYDNQIVATIGVGNENGTRKNALRVNKDGAVYLGAVTKVTDRVVETFDPCNYNGESIYSVNQINTEKKELVSKSVQELLTDINHMESITYWKLRNLANSKKLLPGKTYRITDYTPGLSKTYLGDYDEETQLGNITMSGMPKCILSSHVITKDQDNIHYKLIEDKNYLNRFDICVKAISTSEISDDATAIAHNYYTSDVNSNYFVGTNFNAWSIKYNFMADDKSYDWVNTTVTEPKIRINIPNLQKIQSCAGENWFNSINSLTASGLYQDNELKSILYYNTKTNSYSYFGLEPNYIGVKDNNEDYINVSFDSLEYSFAESYYYTSDVEKQWKQNGSDMTTEPRPTVSNIHTYNYKWLLNMVGKPNKKLFEYCLLTNESDFSYMKNNGNEQMTNILLCKNDRKIAITKRDGVQNPNYYNLPNSKPYVIEVESKANNKLNNENEYVYNAYIYGGEFNGWFGEEPNSGYDIWYILNDYNPQDGIYNVYKDTVGVKLFLVKREINGGNPDFNYYDSSLKTFMTKNGHTGTYTLTEQPIFLGNNIADLNENVTITGEGDKLNIEIKSSNSINFETYKLYKNGENYLTYNYKGVECYVWYQGIDGEIPTSNYQAFLISNNASNGVPTKPEDVTNLYKIYCPVPDTGENVVEITNTTILEYDVVNITPKDGTIIEVEGESMEFIGGDFNRNTTKLEYQNERYYIPFYPDNSDLSNQYRVLAEYTLNLEYELNNTTKLSTNLTAEYYTETCLIPITYVTLDTTNQKPYYEDGKYESTGVIYRLIDEYGNDCPYDFKNIKFFTGDLTSSDLQLSYAYTFDGVKVNADMQDGNNLSYNNKNNVGDISLTGNCVNNKIYLSESIKKNIPTIFFRLAYGKQLINNTFIDCDNCGCMDYGSNTTETKTDGDSTITLHDGCYSQLINNTFKECNLDLVNYDNVTNNYFYKVSGKLKATKFNSDTGSIINSNIVDTSFAQPEFYTLNITNSQLMSCTDLKCENDDNDSEFSYTILSSQIYNGSTIDKRDVPTNANYNVTNLPGIFINQNYHTISGNYSGFMINNASTFDILSERTLTLSTSDTTSGLITLKPSANIKVPEIPQIYSSKYTQTLYYDENTYAINSVSKSRDNGEASGSTSFTYSFSKHDFGTEDYPTYGYGYSFPSTYYDTSLAAYDKLSSPAANYKNTLSLGMFYINSSWQMYTWPAQTNAVDGRSELIIKVTVYYSPYAQTNLNKQSSVSETFYSNPNAYRIGGYWSKSTWSTKTIKSYINFDKLTGTNKTKLSNLGFDTSGSKHFIVISENGKLIVSAIKLEVTAKSFADSTGANNCIGDVWVSYLYHSNSSTQSDAGYSDGSLQGSYSNSSIPYYKPSRYLKAASTNNSDNVYIFAKDGIYVGKISDGNDTSKYKKYIFNETGLVKSN